jgi:hypothetical protein
MKPKAVNGGSLPRLVSCDHANAQCPKQCAHRVPHPPILDIYTGATFSTCDQEASECGWRKDEPMCKCS